MSAREQADSVRQSRKAFKRSLCRLFLKGLKEQSGGRDGERVGGGGENFPLRLISHQLLLDVDPVDGYLCF